METIKMIEAIVVCAVLGYLIGGVNPAYVLAKIKGFDIRTEGSGNAGASNATIMLGKKAGVICALFDIFKAYFAVRVSMRLYPLLKIAGIITGACCILGHIFPVFLNFRGGKGLASLGGVLMAYNLRFFFGLLLAELVLVLVVDYICIVPTSGSFIFAVVLAIQSGILYAMSFAPVVLVIFMRHRDNFRRMHYGVEARVSYLWRKQKEIDRLEKNWYALSDEIRMSFPDYTLPGHSKVVK